ncbi:hypothetical protein BHM03_00046886 [Ensete ventricosum]|nr:hypothetical protein BHM03_00046886 [Ensete ventricosum]
MPLPVDCCTWERHDYVINPCGLLNLEFYFLIHVAAELEPMACPRGSLSYSMEYALRAPLLEQRPYNPSSFELSILVDAVEAGLRLPLHPIIEECLRW